MVSILTDLIEIYFLRISPEMTVYAAGKRLYRRKSLIMGASFVAVLLFSILHGFTLKELGFRIDFYLGGIMPYLVATVTLAPLYYFVCHRYKRQVAVKEKPSLFWFLISIPAQQLVYYGFTYALLARGEYNKILIMLVLGGLYGLVHIMWRNLYFVAGSLGLGLAMGLAYVHYPNIYLSTLTQISFALAITAARQKSLKKLSLNFT